MTQTATHTYTSTEAVYEEIDLDRSVKVKTDIDCTHNEAYVTTGREGGVTDTSDGGNSTEGT